MKVGDRVRLSAQGKEYLGWTDISEGTLTDELAVPYDWLVQWDGEREYHTLAHYENELEVIS